jgi:hypothetical protein
LDLEGKVSTWKGRPGGEGLDLEGKASSREGSLAKGFLLQQFSPKCGGERD